MSQLLQAAAREWGGQGFNIDNDVIAPAFFSSGIPYQSAGVISVNNGGVFNHYHQGLPYDAEGRLIVFINGVVARIAPGGAPFDANGRIAIASTAIDHYASGIPYTVANQLKYFIPAGQQIDIDQMVVWLQSEGWNASNQSGTHLHVADTGESWIQADLDTCNVISSIPALQVDIHQGIEMQGGTCS